MTLNNIPKVKCYFCDQSQGIKLILTRNNNMACQSLGFTLDSKIYPMCETCYYKTVKITQNLFNLMKQNKNWEEILGNILKESKNWRI